MCPSPFRENPPASEPDPQLDKLSASLQRKSHALPAVLVLGGLLSAAPFAYILYGYVRERQQEADHRAEIGKIPASPEEAATIRRDLREAEKTIAAQRERWLSVADKSILARAVPGLQKCPLTWRPPNTQSAASYVTHGTKDYQFGDGAFTLVRTGAAITLSNRRLDEAGAAVANVRAKLDANLEESRDVDAISVIADGSFFIAQSDILVLADDQVAAKVTDQGYSGGSLSAHAYLIEDHKVKCAGVFDTSNAPRLELRYFGSSHGGMQIQAALDRDLEVAILRALTEVLRIVQ